MAKFKFTCEQVDFLIENYKPLKTSELRDLFNAKFGTNLTNKQISGKVQQLEITNRNIQENYGKYAPEMIDWLKANYPNKMSVEDLTSEFNRRFGTTFTASAIRHKANRLTGNKYDRSGRYIPRVVWTTEMVEFLSENYDTPYTNKELANIINARFNTRATESSIDHKACSLGLKKSPESIQKILKAKPSWTKYRKVMIPATKKPIGFTRIQPDGYAWVKTKEPDIFETLHRIIYKQHYGEIEEGMNIVFLNGDKTDYRIENLVALTNSELALFNNTKINANNNDDIARVKLALTKYRFTLFKKKKERNECKYASKEYISGPPRHLDGDS